MSIVDGDWTETFNAPGTSREVAGRELVYHQTGSGLEGAYQVLVGSKWLTIETITGNTFPKAAIFANIRSFRFVATGTGNVTFTLSPSTALIG